MRIRPKYITFFLMGIILMGSFVLFGWHYLGFFQQDGLISEEVSKQRVRAEVNRIQYEQILKEKERECVEDLKGVYDAERQGCIFTVGEPFGNVDDQVDGQKEKMNGTEEDVLRKDDGEGIIRAYYKYISEGKLEDARILRGDGVSSEVFKNRYGSTDYANITKLNQIGDNLYKLEVDYSEYGGQVTEIYTVVMRVENGKIYTQKISAPREVVDLSKGLQISSQEYNGKNELYLLRGERKILVDNEPVEFNGHKSWISYGDFEFLNDRYLRYWMYAWEYGEQRIYDTVEEKRVLELPVANSGGFAGEGVYYACALSHFGGEKYVDIYSVKDSFKKVFSLNDIPGFPFEQFIDSMECTLSESEKNLIINVRECEPKFRECSKTTMPDRQWKIDLKTFETIQEI